MEPLNNKLKKLNIKTTIHSQFVHNLTKEIINYFDIKNKEEIIEFSKYHDIGKIYCLDLITTDRRLDHNEFLRIQNHTTDGANLIKKYSKIGFNIAKYHHENYDGSGYPDKLKGENIPFEARLIKIIDVYEALRSKRTYKEKITHNDSIQIISKGDWIVNPLHFDENILNKFLDNHRNIEKIYNDLEKKLYN